MSFSAVFFKSNSQQATFAGRGLLTTNLEVFSKLTLHGVISGFYSFTLRLKSEFSFKSENSHYTYYCVRSNYFLQLQAWKIHSEIISNLADFFHMKRKLKRCRLKKQYRFTATAFGKGEHIRVSGLLKIVSWLFLS